jgi:Fe-S-cluster containining protein
MDEKPWNEQPAGEQLAGERLAGEQQGDEPPGAEQAGEGQMAAHAETATVEFSVSLGEGQFTATAVVPAGTTNLTQILPVLRSLEDSLIAGVSGQLNQLGRTIFEAESLADWIRTLPEEVQAQLAARFDQALRRFAVTGLIDRMVDEDWLAKTDSARELAVEYLHQRIACPFLEDESCSIHPIRPLVCREYMVTSPSEHCYNPSVMEVQPVYLPLHFSRRLYQMGAQLENDSRGWIPLIFLFAWMKANATPGSGFTGEGPHVLYEFLKDLKHSAIGP